MNPSVRWGGCRTATAAVVLFALAGCAAKITSSTPRAVIIDAGRPPTLSGGQAQAMADAECRKHGRYARMTGRPLPGATTEFVFECID